MNRDEWRKQEQIIIRGGWRDAAAAMIFGRK